MLTPRPLPRDRAGPPPTGRVPVEWIGRARALRKRIAAAHPNTEATTEALIFPLRPRPDFAPQYGPRMLHLAASRWRALPDLGRLRLVARLEAGKLDLAELRLVPSRIDAARWSEDEPALGVMLRTVAVAPPTFEEKALLIVGVGLHALARRYERGADRADRAVLADLLPIAVGYPALIRARGEFAVPVRGGGRWIGAVSAGDAVALVRTFLS
jgi:hypothetical protein